MKRLKRFVMRLYEHGDVFWLSMMIACIVFALAAPWYLGWIGAIVAVFYYDMAIE